MPQSWIQRENWEFETHRPTDGIAATLQAMRTLTPSHVVFNGRVGALTGDGTMTARVGETVLFIHSQANRDSRPHLIGGHGDYVWEQGSFADPPAHGLETWFVRGGSAGAAVYTFRQPGLYAYLTHNLIEAVELGALAHVMVEGAWDDDLMTQVMPPVRWPAGRCLITPHHRASGRQLIPAPSVFASRRASTAFSLGVS